MATTRGIVLATVLVVCLAVAGCGGDAHEGTDGIPSDAAGSGAETAGTSGEAPPVHFYQEYVIIEPSARGCRVDGLYFMRNLSDRPLEMVVEYPFPVGGPFNYPYQIFIDDVSDEGEQSIGFVQTEESVTFTLRFEPEGERRFRARYAQQVRGGRATYIVTTTRRWERPIDLAEFEIRIPPDLENATISLEPDRTESRRDTTVYFISRTDFYPEENIVIRWDD